MKTKHLVVLAFAILRGALPAHAHDIDPSGKIEVACVNDTVRMGAITSAVHDGHYWAPQTARRQMLSFARQACSRGAKVVTFVAPVDRRSCATPPTWSTLCVEQTATAHDAVDRSVAPSSSAHH